MEEARLNLSTIHIAETSSATKNNGVVASITDVPDHILMEICSKLSLNSICRCRSVCKTWFNTLKNPNFIQLHFDRASVCPLFRKKHNTLHYCPRRELYLVEFERDNVNFNSHGTLDLNNAVFKLPLGNPLTKASQRGFDIVNSCNGFLCLRGKLNSCPIAIYSPVTGEYSVLPVPGNVDKASTEVSIFGLGFCPNTNQYKVLMTVNIEDGFCSSCDNVSNCKSRMALIYTFGLEGGWRKVGSPPCFTCCLALNYKPVFLNGVLHFLVEVSGLRKAIMSFDFESENFCTSPAPSDVNRVDEDGWSMAIGSRTNLRMISGRLYLLDYNDLNRIDMWIMKDYGVVESWVKEYSYVIDVIDGESWNHRLCQQVDVTNNWDFLLYSRRRNIYFVDEHFAVRYLKMGETESPFAVFAYVPSFFSLKDIVGDSLEVFNVQSSYTSWGIASHSCNMATEHLKLVIWHQHNFLQALFICIGQKLFRKALDLLYYVVTVFMHRNLNNHCQDNYMGLVKQVVSSLYKRNIQRLMRKYSTLFLEDISNLVQLLNSPKKAEKRVLQMVTIDYSYHSCEIKQRYLALLVLL